MPIPATRAQLIVVMQWVLAAVCVALCLHVAITQINQASLPGDGADFRPVYGAGSALLHGRSLYSVARFVYPPTAAALFMPLTLASFAHAYDAWLVLSAIAVAGAGALALSPWRSRTWLLLTPVAAVVMLRSDYFTRTLWLGNISLVLAPFAVGVLLLYENDEWEWGSALLVATLLVKPLLWPFVLIAPLRGRWRALAWPLLAGVLLLVVAVVAVPGASSYGHILRYLDSGSSLTGSLGFLNDSISGLAQWQHLELWGWIARALVVAGAAWALLRWAPRSRSPGAAAAAGALALLAVMLAGPLSEDHYLLVAAPCVLAALALDRRWSLAGVIALPALVLFGLPAAYISSAAAGYDVMQVRTVLLELLLAATAAELLRAGARDADPLALPARVRFRPRTAPVPGGR